MIPRAVVVSVGLGVAFGAGVVFGDAGKSSSAAADLEEVSLARADERAAQLDSVRERLKLSFHTELQKAEQAALPLQTAPVPAALVPPKKSEHKAPAAEVAAAPPVTDADTTPPPEPKIAAKPKADDDDDDRDAAVRTGDEGDVSVGKSADRMKQALDKVLGAPAKPAAPALAPATKASWALQIASANTQAGADGIAAKLQQSGHRAAVVAADIPGRGTVYRVRIRGFASKEAAEKYRERLEGQGLVVGE